jgi:hypothetical protein
MLERVGASDRIEAQTRDCGLAFMAGVPPGRYRLRVNAPGFKEQVLPAFVVRAGKTVGFYVPLELAGRTEPVLNQTT